MVGDRGDARMSRLNRYAEQISDLLGYLQDQLQARPEVIDSHFTEGGIVIEYDDHGNRAVARLTMTGLVQELMGAIEDGDPRAYLDDLLASALPGQDDDLGDMDLAVVPVSREDVDSTAMPLRREIIDGLDAAIVFDQPTRIRFARPVDLQRIGITEPDAWDDGIRNLSRLVEIWTGGHGAQRCAALITGDSNDAARGLLCPNIILPLVQEAQISPPWMLAVPSRDIAVVTSGADPKHLLGFTEQCASDYRAARHRVAGRPVLLDEQARPVRLVSFDELG